MARHAKGMGPVWRGVRELGLALIAAGVIVLLFAAYQLLGTNLTESNNQAQLKKSFQAAVQSDSATVGGPTTGTPTTTSPPTTGTARATTAGPGDAIDHLVIPKIGVSKYIIEGVTDADLSKGPGHYPETVLPGQQGNAAIAGHRTTYGAPFFRLNELSVGDPIYITNTAGTTFTYRVSQPTETVSPNDVGVLNPTADAQLTLTTCTPRFEATNRLIVVAVLAPGEKALPVTSTARLDPPTAVPAEETLGQGDSVAWPPSLYYGALALVAWIIVRVVINRTRRWRRLAAYVIGIGVCLVPLWLCFENVVRLFPPNI